MTKWPTSKKAETICSGWGWVLLNGRAGKRFEKVYGNGYGGHSTQVAHDDIDKKETHKQNMIWRGHEAMDEIEWTMDVNVYSSV